MNLNGCVKFKISNLQRASQIVVSLFQRDSTQHIQLMILKDEMASPRGFEPLYRP